MSITFLNLNKGYLLDWLETCHVIVARAVCSIGTPASDSSETKGHDRVLLRPCSGARFGKHADQTPLSLVLTEP
jgi:hypothetical protein